MDDFVCSANSNDTDYFFFEMKDETCTLLPLFPSLIGRLLTTVSFLDAAHREEDLRRVRSTTHRQTDAPS